MGGDTLEAPPFQVVLGRRAFTLVELLVAISIIVLLIALLLPALAGTREAGRAAVCSSNLHQQAVAYLSYATDSQDVMPKCYVAGAPDPYPAPVTIINMGYLQGVSVAGVLHSPALTCPSGVDHYDPWDGSTMQVADVVFADGFSSLVAFQAGTSPEDALYLFSHYVVNGMIMESWVAGPLMLNGKNRPFWGDPASGDPDRSPVIIPLSHATHPEQTFMASDASPAYDGGVCYPAFRHSRTAQYSYLDGHGDRLTPESMTRGAAAAGPGYDGIYGINDPRGWMVR